MKTGPKPFEMSIELYKTLKRYNISDPVIAENEHVSIAALSVWKKRHGLNRKYGPYKRRDWEMMPHVSPQFLKEVVETMKLTYNLDYTEIADVMGVSPSWFYKILCENRSVSVTNSILIKHRLIAFMRQRKEAAQ